MPSVQLFSDASSHVVTVAYRKNAIGSLNSSRTLLVPNVSESALCLEMYIARRLATSRR